MEIEFDPEKNERNIRVRGIPFTLAAKFDFSSALILEDKRQNYGEARYQAIGYIESRLYVLVFTPRGEIMRVISLRKANRREVKRYGRYIQKSRP
ncbi:MAG: BrnT family toxin [Methylohalobius sp.]|nr:BrnT family toxin [Methylohalobius sp.]